MNVSFLCLPIFEKNANLDEAKAENLKTLRSLQKPAKIKSSFHKVNKIIRKFGGNKTETERDKEHIFRRNRMTRVSELGVNNYIPQPG